MKNNFDDILKLAQSPEDCWRGLEDFTQSIVDVRLFTVTTVDMPNLLARRVYSNMPLEYAVSGTKPITIDAWFEIVHGQKKMFVANTIVDIAKVFPDHQKIWALGCGSVVNLPVIVDDELVATINLLHEEQFYTPDRVARIADQLTEPAKVAYRRAI